MNGDGAPTEPPVKRPRGRPRKVVPDGAPAAPVRVKAPLMRKRTGMPRSVDLKGLLRALAMVAGKPDPGERIPLHEPRFAGRERELVLDCIDTGWVSSVGSYVDGFERMVATACGASHAVAVVNGTAALHMALLLSGVEPGDEVIVPTLTFVATVNAVSYCFATPHFVDADTATLGIDPLKLSRHLDRIARREGGATINRLTGKRIRAIVPMHTFGHPVDLDRIVEIARRHHLQVVEDATESLGSRYKGRLTGAIARVGAISFNGNKIVTTGGGGAVVTNDPALAKAAKHLTTTAKLPHPFAFDHDRVGYNYRLPNINAALGVAQLEQLDAMLAAKRRVTQAYALALKDVRGVRLLTEQAYATSNYWLNTILLDEDNVETRDAVLAATNDAGFMTRPVWTAMHRLPMYTQCPRDDLSVAESLERRIVNIPSSAKHGMSRAELRSDAKALARRAGKV